MLPSPIIRERPGKPDEYVWLYFMFGRLPMEQWYQIADLLVPHGRLHFHILTKFAAEADGPSVFHVLPPDQDQNALEQFAAYIRQSGGKTSMSSFFDMVSEEHPQLLVARLMQLLESRKAFIRLRKNIYAQFPDVHRGSGQLVGEVLTENGNFIEKISK